MTGSTEPSFDTVSLLEWDDISRASETLQDERREIMAAVAEEMQRGDGSAASLAVCRRLLCHIANSSGRLPS
jgi:hypothetical protein